MTAIKIPKELRTPASLKEPRRSIIGRLNHLGDLGCGVGIWHGEWDGTGCWGGDGDWWVQVYEPNHPRDPAEYDGEPIATGKGIELSAAITVAYGQAIPALIRIYEKWQEDFRELLAED